MSANGPYDAGLNDASKTGNLLKVQQALKNGISADSLASKWSSEDDMRPIHYAAYHNHQQIASELLASGADPNRKQGGRYTPLHYAAFFEHCQVAKVLVDAGGDPNIPDDDGRTPISHARQKDNKEMLAILLGE